MQFTVLRETPANSGTFVASGEVLDTTADAIVGHVLDLAAANGTRYAAQPYDPVARPAASQHLSGPPVVYAAADNSAIVTANQAVQVFAAGSVPNGADVVNTLSVTLYLDPTGAVALAGSPTAIPLSAGQSYHFPKPPIAGVSAVAAAPGAFVAVRY